VAALGVLGRTAEDCVKEPCDRRCARITAGLTLPAYRLTANLAVTPRCIVRAGQEWILLLLLLLLLLAAAAAVLFLVAVAQTMLSVMRCRLQSQLQAGPHSSKVKTKSAAEVDAWFVHIVMMNGKRRFGGCQVLLRVVVGGYGWVGAYTV